MITIYKEGTLLAEPTDIIDFYEISRGYWEVENNDNIPKNTINKNEIAFHRFDNSLNQPEYVCIKFVDGKYKSWLRKVSYKKSFFKDTNRNIEIFCLNRTAYNSILNSSITNEELKTIFYKLQGQSFIVFYFTLFPGSTGGGNSGVKIPNG